VRILAIVGPVLVGLLLIAVGAAGAYWYLEASNTAIDEPEMDVEKDSTKGSIDTRKRIDRDAIRQLLAFTDHGRRSAILNSDEHFNAFVEQERANQAVLVAANVNQAHIDKSVSALMKRAAQKVLAAAYLGQVVQRNLDPGFPNDAQSREYYAENVAAYYLPDRMHLWQVFIPLPEDASSQVEKNALKLASTLASDLQKGAKTFTEVVIKHSKHVQSRVNDGYMGLLKIADIVPGIRAAVDKMAVGEISIPIRSESGFHVIKKGLTVAGSQLDYETVKQRIKAQMRQNAETRVRQAAVKKILKTYPIELDMMEVNTWHQEFKTEQWPNTIISSRDRS
jgi:hypothetical protein